MVEIKLIDQISSDVEEKMLTDIIKYEANHGIDVNYKRFCLTCADEHNEIIGVLNAYTVFAEIYIDDLWIDFKSRRKGFGKKLIYELEEHFKDKGFNNINLVTSAFQAPEFYIKCGYELELTRNNPINPKLTKFFFVKYFKNKIQTQGILQNSKKDDEIIE